MALNVYDQFQDLFAPAPRGVATITGQRSGGIVTATTPSGTALILRGKADTGSTVYYDQNSHEIIGEAPAVVYTEMGV